MSIELNWLEVGGGAAAFVAYVVVGTVMLNRFRQRRMEREEQEGKHEEEFIQLLEQAMRNDAIAGLDDIHDLYEGHFRQGAVENWQHKHVTALLKRSIVHLSKLPISKIGNAPRANYLRLMKHAAVESDKLFQQAQQLVPFSGVPDPERGLLTDITLLVPKETPGVSEKLRELAASVKGRQDTMSMLAEEKGQSLKWAKWGLFGTVFFSAVSILITVLK